MSVVNRMLQDIDRRNTGTPAPPEGPFSGVRSVPEDAARGPRGKLRLRLMGLAVLATVVGAVTAIAWTSMKNQDEAAARAPRPSAATLQAANTPPPQPAASVPAPVPAEPNPVATPAPAAAEPMVARERIAKPAPEVAPAEPKAPRSRAAPIEPFRLSLKLSEPAAAPATSAMPLATALATVPVAMAAPASRRSEAPLRQVAAEETIVTARNLWSRGAQADALETLREALAAVEASRNVNGVRTLVRELARLEVAANRPGVALDLLKRHEAILADDAESWALRGNAEQRLALHADAATSYLAAQRLAPAEGKWMLGAAISLAAQGRNDEAQAWVDRARDRGAITPTIAAYLQELGIAPRR